MGKATLIAILAVGLIGGASGYFVGLRQGTQTSMLEINVASTRLATETEAAHLRRLAAVDFEKAQDASQVILSAGVESLQAYVEDPQLREDAAVICREDLPRLQALARSSSERLRISERLGRSIGKLDEACKKAQS
jgi:hypothetical protein